MESSIGKTLDVNKPTPIEFISTPHLTQVEGSNAAMSKFTCNHKKKIVNVKHL